MMQRMGVEGKENSQMTSAFSFTTFMTLADFSYLTSMF